MKTENIAENSNPMEDLRNAKEMVSFLNTGTFKSAFLPSLKHIALINACTSFWTPVHSYKLNSFEEFSNRWYEIEHRIKQNVRQLNLPKTLKKQILCLIKIIGCQIRKWMEYHDQNMSILLADDFCWTQGGTIDKKKTAEIILKNEALPAPTRYKLACIYCLDYYIPVIWKEMREWQRFKFNHFRCSDPLITYWTCITAGKEQKLNQFIRNTTGHDNYTPAHFAFMVAEESGNVDASEYFWQKLTPEERCLSLVTTTAELTRKCRETDFAHAFFYLLSKMVEEDQAEVFEGCAVGVAKCLTDWPWQRFLLQTLNRIPTRLQETYYKKVLYCIALKQSPDCRDCIYKELFAEVWKQMPNFIKIDVLIHLKYGQGLIVCLLRNRDITSIKLVFGSVTKEFKKELLFSYSGCETCQRFIEDGAWDLLEFFIEQCVTSKHHVIQFREIFSEFFAYKYWRFTAAHSEKVKKFQETLFNVIYKIELRNRK